MLAFCPSGSSSRLPSRRQLLSSRECRCSLRQGIHPGRRAAWGFSFFRLVELAHLHYRLGNIPESFWNGQAAHLEGLMSYAGVRKIWEIRKHVFSEEFQKFVNESLEGSSISTEGYLTDFYPSS